MRILPALPATLFVLTAALLWGLSTGGASAQSLDPAYGDGGFAEGRLAQPSFDLVDMVFGLRDDGAMYYATVQYDDTKTPTSHFSRVGRLTPDGQDDASFGEDGVHFVRLPGLAGDPNGTTTRVWSMAADARGRVVLAGNSSRTVYGPPYPGTLPSMPFVYRLLPDGTADPTFSNDRIDVSLGLFYKANAGGLAISGQRHYVALNYTDGRCGVAQVDGSGDLVPGFGVGGVVRLSNPEGFPRCITTGVSVDRRGRPVLMLTRSVTEEDVIIDDAVAVRFRLNGTFDPSFGIGGIYTPASGSPSTGGRIAVAPDQRIHMSWFEPVVGPPTLTVARVTRNADRGSEGALWRWQNPFPNGISPLHTIQPEPDGGTLVSTRADVDGQSFFDLVIARLTPQGRLDPAFGDGGVHVEYSRDTPVPFRFYRNHFLGRGADGSIYSSTRVSLGDPLRDAPMVAKYRVGAPLVARAPGSAATVALEIRVAPNPSAGPVTVWVPEMPGETVRIFVVDLLGREVATVVERRPSTGPIEASWEAAAVGAGVYHVVVEAGARRHTVPVTVLR